MFRFGLGFIGVEFFVVNFFFVEFVNSFFCGFVVFVVDEIEIFGDIFFVFGKGNRDGGVERFD